MPRAGGTYSLPPGSSFSPNTTIESAKVNAINSDLESDANTARPIVAGGTGGTTAVQGHDNLTTIGANIASATTTDLSTATGIALTVTGTTTITAFGTEQAGALRVLTFAGALTLTHNATSLILPGGISIITAAGDVAIMLSLGSGNWRCIAFQAAAGMFGRLVSADAGAGLGPTLSLLRDSASPAANDLLGDIYWYGRDSAGNLEQYAHDYVQIVDPTSTSEDANRFFETKQGGTLASRLGMGLGIWGPNATGGDQGADTANFKQYFNDGVALPEGVAAQSDQETGSSTVLAVTSGRQHFHPSAAKCFAWVTQSGATPTLHANSYNITSITDAGTGELTITIATDFSSSNWASLCSVSTGTDRLIFIASKAAGSVGLESSDIAGTPSDPGSGWSFVGYGDQA